MTNFYQRRDGNNLPKSIHSLQRIRQSFQAIRVSTTLFAVAASVIPVYAQTVPPTLSILHSFYDGSIANDGVTPNSQLIRGSDGNFYGTTYSGGSGYNGTIFKMSPNGTITILHNFGDGTVKNDGLHPLGLVEANDGYFYGTTRTGGATTRTDPNGDGYGTAFRMTPSGVVTILHSFGDGSIKYDGINPGLLAQGLDGNFYGTTGEGGSTTGSDLSPSGNGTIFRMTPSGIITILHSFTSFSLVATSAPLLQAADGNFYGTTDVGGINQLGSIFSITPSGNFTTLHSFGSAPDRSDGMYPISGLIQDANGDFYGTSQSGGSEQGIVYRFRASGSFAVLHSFGDNTLQKDGIPNSILLGPDGNLYGTTGDGGTRNAGIVYLLSPDGTLTTLHSFEDGTTINDGAYPVAPLTEFSDGSLFGVTEAGGSTADPANVATGQGTVFRLATTLPPPFPLTPIQVRAFTRQNEVRLSWKQAPDATAYNVYRGTSSGLESKIPIGKEVSTKGFVDKEVKNGVRYYYRVSAQNSTGESPHSVEVSATTGSTVPSAPTGLSAATELSNGNIALTWKASPEAISYNVYIGTSPGGESSTPIASGLASTSYISTHLLPGTTYYYTVSAVNTYGQSPVSAEAHSTLTPPAPTSIKITSTGSSITLTWSASPGALKYTVYRGWAPGGESAPPLAMGVSTTTFTNIGLTPGEFYYYKIAATNAAGEGPKSYEVHSTPILTAPTGLTAEALVKMVHLAWNHVNGATSYSVYRSTTPGEEGYQPIAAGLTKANYTDSNVSAGQVYYYKVEAYDSIQLSPMSTEVHAIPKP